MQRDVSRRLLGLVTVCAIALLADLLPSGPFPIHVVFGNPAFFIPTIWAFMASFAVFAAGAYVSRSGFMSVAISFALSIWWFSQYLLYRIAVPAGPPGLPGMLLGNVPSLFMMVMTATLGTLAGERLSDPKDPSGDSVV